MILVGIAAVNDRRNTAPEFPIHKCPLDGWQPIRPKDGGAEDGSGNAG
jgi:hypothetical protein